MVFNNPWLLILAPLAVLWVIGRMRRSVLPHSRTVSLTRARSLRIPERIQQILLGAFWLTCVVGLARPMQLYYTQEQTIDARDFVIMVDTSGSMLQVLKDRGQQEAAGDTESKARRCDAARVGVELFLSRREGDRVGLLIFNDKVFGVWPLSSDLDPVLRRVGEINRNPTGGTNFAGPYQSESNTGAIQSGINHFDDRGQSKTKVLIMVTDGADDIPDERYSQLMQEMRERGIRLYVIGVGEDWTSGKDIDLRRFTEELGGKVIVVGDAQAMMEGFAEIDSLERSIIKTESVEHSRDLFQYFVVVAFVLFILRWLWGALLHDDL